MFTHLKRALVALVLATTLPACSAAASPESDVDDASASTSALAKDVGDEPMECGPCTPNTAWPQGGVMRCETETGLLRNVGCTPPPPPPPPPPTTAPCTEVRDGTSCHRVCCTQVGGAQRCSALPCGTSVVAPIAIGGLVLTTK